MLRRQEIFAPQAETALARIEIGALVVDLEANDALISAEPFAVQAKDHRTAGQGTGPMIYVTRKGPAYDSIVPGDLPNEGLF